jgi:hypothetical protein
MFGVIGWKLFVERRPVAEIFAGLRRHVPELEFLFVAIAMPLIFLNLSVSASPVIGGYLSVPVLCFVMVLATATAGRGIRAPVPVIAGRSLVAD